MQTEHKTKIINATKVENPLLQARRNSLLVFGDIEHRLELVSEINGIEYVNDSKSTDVSSTWYSLEYMIQPVVWIIETNNTETDYSIFNEMISNNIKTIISFGNNNRIIEKVLNNKVKTYNHTETIEEAVIKSTTITKKGDIVLFSPACACSHKFKDYKERGEIFRKTVNSLK